MTSCLALQVMHHPTGSRFTRLVMAGVLCALPIVSSSYLAIAYLRTSLPDLGMTLIFAATPSEKSMSGTHDRLEAVVLLSTRAPGLGKLPAQRVRTQATRRMHLSQLTWASFETPNSIPAIAVDHEISPSNFSMANFQRPMGRTVAKKSLLLHVPHLPRNLCKPPSTLSSPRDSANTYLPTPTHRAGRIH